MIITIRYEVHKTNVPKLYPETLTLIKNYCRLSQVLLYSTQSYSSKMIFFN